VLRLIRERHVLFILQTKLRWLPPGAAQHGLTLEAA
jgi:hypothetical protein